MKDKKVIENYLINYNSYKLEVIKKEVKHTQTNSARSNKQARKQS